MAQTDLAVGSYCKIVLGEPTTYDVAGFEALTWSPEIDDVVSVGAGGGTAAVQSYIPLKTGVEVKRAGAISYNDRAINMGRHVQLDATHQLVKSGFDGANKGKVFSLAIHYADGSIDFQIGTISGFTDENLEANTFKFSTFTFSPTKGIVTKAGTDLFTLTYLAGANGFIVGDTVQTVEDGEDGTYVYAQPTNAVTHEFSQWSDASTTNPRRHTNVTANVTLTASFVTV